MVNLKITEYEGLLVTFDDDKDPISYIIEKYKYCGSPNYSLPPKQDRDTPWKKQVRRKFSKV